MGHLLYSNDKLVQMGRSNYEKLVSYCEELEKRGFWNQARQVINQSSTQVLDTYVQSVLLNLAVHCGKILDNQKQFIFLVTNTNPLRISEEEEIGDSVLAYSKKVAGLPPVLLQLCGVYDVELAGDMLANFLDAFLNILLCMAYLNDGKDIQVNQFIQDYYNKISMFIQFKEEQGNSSYLFRKLSSNRIGCDAAWLAQDISRTDNEKEDITILKTVSEKKEKRPSGTEIQQETEKETKQRQKEQESAKKSLLQEQKEEEEKQCREEALAKEEFQKVKKRIQEREKTQKEAQEKRVSVLLEELNSLVGLGNVKDEIRSLINLIKIRGLREEMGMPMMDMSYHMVFTGSPGTGKTTVARLVARIYKELGILSEGNLIETDRSGLVAGYVGQTAINVKDVVEQAVGGVLFIDEAYALVNKEMGNDFGSEAVDTLVKLMEDHRDNLVVIAAGYTEEMKGFLKSNTGLISRFNKFISFEDYSQEELLDILDVMAGRAGLEIETGAREQVGKKLASMSSIQWEEFGNARGIRNVFEKIVVNQANRLVMLKEPNREQLMTIIEEDAC